MKTQKLFFLLLALFLTAPSFIPINAHAQSTNLYDQLDATERTDQEKANAELYLHQGLIDKKYKEECVGENNAIKSKCLERRNAFNGDIEKYLPIAKQAYTMIFSLAPDLNKVGYYGKMNTKTNVREVKSKTDWCGMIPLATETVAAGLAKIKNQSIEDAIKNPKNPQAQQAEAFYAMARVQENLVESSKTQAYGWGSTAACYGTMLATSIIAPTTGVFLKLAAAGSLTYFYSEKIKAHKQRAAAYKKLGDEFPQAGDCNPFTNTSCFCLEKTSRMSDPANYQKFCVPKEFHSNRVDAISCVTADYKPDPKCSCKSKGTCLQGRLAKLGHNIGLSPAVMNNVLKATKPFSSGYLGGNLQAATDRNLAFAKKQLKKFKPKNIAFKNNKQKEMAKELARLGFPKGAAAKLATTAGTNPLPASFNTFGAGSFGNRNSFTRRARTTNKKPRYKKGGTAKKAYSKSSRRKFGRSRGSSRSNSIEIEDFASKAERSAMNNMITKDKSKPIFDIITYRYKTSAWREFKEHIKKEIKETEPSDN